MKIIGLDRRMTSFGEIDFLLGRFTTSYQKVFSLFEARVLNSQKGKLCLLLSLMLLLVEGAQLSVSGRTNVQMILEGPVYGPPKSFNHIQDVPVSFSQSGKAFDGRIQLWRLDELSRADLEDFIVMSTPKSLRPRLKKYLDLALYYAEQYQIDPFWVISVMWVESHFKPKIKSSVKATGLMQIMPSTGLWLNTLLKRKIQPSVLPKLTEDPGHNVQLGVFYLKRLLKKFKGNYIHSTVAYNMGPGYTIRRLRWGMPVGKRNLYLNKVRSAYARLTFHTRKYLTNNAPSYLNTYVVKSRLPVELKAMEVLSLFIFPEMTSDFVTIQ